MMIAIRRPEGRSGRKVPAGVAEHSPQLPLSRARCSRTGEAVPLDPVSLIDLRLEERRVGRIIARALQEVREAGPRPASSIPASAHML